MKKRSKSIVTSILSIALCGSLITGATYALFTDQADNSIVISNGKVDVSATIQNLKVYSPTAIFENGSISNADNAATTTETGGVWKNGGSVTLNESTLTLDKMTPGDKVDFEIKIVNNSDVTIQYYTVAKAVHDNGLIDELSIKLGSEFVGDDLATEWTTLTTNDEREFIVECSVELPLSVTDQTFEGQSSIQFSVVALQGNAVSAPADTQSLVALFDEAKAAAVNGEVTVVLDQSYDASGWESFSLSDISKLTIDGDGKTLYGLQNPLIDTLTGGKTVEISNLTLNGAHISKDASDSLGLGALVKNAGVDTISFNNCKLLNSSVVCTDSYAGGLIGYVSGSKLTMDGCKVSNSTISGNGTAGGFVGLTGGATISNCSIEGSTVTCKEENKTWRIGLIGGTFNANASTLTNCRDMGENTLSQTMAQAATLDNTEGKISRLFGRTTVVITIDGTEQVVTGG